MHPFLYGVFIVLLYLAVAAAIAFPARLFLKVPDELFRKTLHFILLGAYIPLVFAFSEWWMATVFALILIVVLLPVLLFAHKIPKVSSFVNERKSGEFTSSMVFAVGMMAFSIAICWGLFGDRYLVLASIYAWGVVGVVIFASLFLFIFGSDKWQILTCIFAIVPLIAAILFAGAKIPTMNIDAAPKTFECRMAALLFGSTEINLSSLKLSNKQKQDISLLLNPPAFENTDVCARKILRDYKDLAVDLCMLYGELECAKRVEEQKKLSPCVTIGSLAIGGNDVIVLGFDKRNTSKILNFALDGVIENPTINEKDKLIQYILNNYAE